MATIDKIQVQGTTYDINLPSSASPTISSLTITGNLTVSGTANLSVINCSSLTLSKVSHGSSSQPIYIDSNGRIATCYSYNSLNTTVYNSQRLGGVTASLYLREDQVNFYQHNICARMIDSGTNVGVITFQYINSVSTARTNNDQLLLDLTNNKFVSTTSDYNIIPCSGIFNNSFNPVSIASSTASASEIRPICFNYRTSTQILISVVYSQVRVPSLNNPAVTRMYFTETISSLSVIKDSVLKIM